MSVEGKSDLAHEQVPSPKAQAETLSFMVGERIYWEIEENKFPDIPIERVGLAKFWAIDNSIDGFQNALSVAQNPELKDQLSRLITKLIDERDQYLLDSLKKVDLGEADEEKIAKQANFRMPGDLSRLMDMVIGIGLIDQLNVKNFPALRSLSQKDFMLLKLQSLSHRLNRLEDIKNELKSSSGFKKEEVDLNKNELDKEIGDLKDLQSEILTKYLHS